MVDDYEEIFSVDAMTPRIDQSNSRAVTSDGINQASQSNLSVSPTTADQRLKALQERLIHLEELNSRLKTLKREASIPKRVSSSDSDDIGVPQTRESASIPYQYHDGDSMLASPYNVESKIVGRELGQDKNTIFRKNSRVSASTEGQNASTHDHSQEENSNPKAVIEELTSRRASLVQIDTGRGSGQHTPNDHSAINTLRRNNSSWNSILRLSAHKLNVNSRSAARY